MAEQTQKSASSGPLEREVVQQGREARPAFTLQAWAKLHLEVNANTDADMASYTWWEKTVEYAFVTRNVFDCATPLSGIPEKAGDTIFSNGERFVLVEFKRDVSTLSSEIVKYKDYEAAKAALSGADGHHIFVYGDRAQKTTEGVRLQLAVRTYFSAVPIVDLDMHAVGLPKRAFDAYIEALVKFKNDDGRSGGGDFMAAMSTVIGITRDRKTVTISLNEYRTHILKHQLANQLRKNATRGPSEP